MAKKEDAGQANEQTGLVSIPGENNEQINVADLLASVADAEVGQELGSDYFTVEPGETERVVFIEMTKMNKMGSDSEMIDAVRLLGADGKLKICADKVLVSTCRNIASNGRRNVPLQIICKGKIKSVKGSYKDLQINELLMK
jgi:hypothetical protein